MFHCRLLKKVSSKNLFISKKQNYFNNFINRRRESGKQHCSCFRSKKKLIGTPASAFFSSKKCLRSESEISGNTKIWEPPEKKIGIFRSVLPLFKNEVSGPKFGFSDLLQKRRHRLKTSKWGVAITRMCPGSGCAGLVLITVSVLISLGTVLKLLAYTRASTCPGFRSGIWLSMLHLDMMTRLAESCLW